MIKGTDLKTLQAILLSAYKQTKGNKMIHIGTLFLTVTVMPIAAMNIAVMNIAAMNIAVMNIAVMHIAVMNNIALKCLMNNIGLKEASRRGHLNM
jgi:hypothetical protein